MTSPSTPAPETVERMCLAANRHVNPDNPKKWGAATENDKDAIRELMATLILALTDSDIIAECHRRGI